MFRSLLAVSLLMWSAAAFAADPAPAQTPEATCPKSEAEHEKTGAVENGKATPRPGTTAPVRSRTDGTRGTPRWHSLLPGMFR